MREYYQILCDTLLGRMVLPYRRRQDRRVLSRTPKFYLFDVGGCAHCAPSWRSTARAPPWW